LKSTGELHPTIPPAALPDTPEARDDELRHSSRGCSPLSQAGEFGPDVASGLLKQIGNFGLPKVLATAGAP
jgi:hypothetical protein